jgi:energy-converting hydrogenase Eha subunit A
MEHGSMFAAVQIISTILVALAMAMALAHALELPGKMRLARENYLAVQTIYYPGFTIAGGIGEVGGLISTLVLLILTPPGSVAFWLMLVAFVGLIGMQAVYWIVTHPVNKYWLQGEALKGFGSAFFGLDPANRSQPQSAAVPTDWAALRDRWEYSHVVRAALGLVSLIALLIAARS